MLFIIEIQNYVARFSSNVRQNENNDIIMIYPNDRNRIFEPINLSKIEFEIQCLYTHSYKETYKGTAN